MNDEQTKICSNENCIHGGKPQPLSNFYKRGDRKSGYQSRCKDCFHEYEKKYKNRHKKYYQDNKETINKKRMEKYYEDIDKSREKAREYWNNRKESAKAWQKAPAKMETYGIKLEKYEDIRVDPDNSELFQVRCKNVNCCKWFNPTNQQSYMRLRAINNNDGNFLYCSEECKLSCPIFRVRKDPFIFEDKNFRRDNLQNELTELILERDNYTCQMCGKSKTEYPDLKLICHHIIPYKINKFFSADEDNCITVCEECHQKCHHLPGCTTYELGKLDCLSLINNKNNMTNDYMKNEIV